MKSRLQADDGDNVSTCPGFFFPKQNQEFTDKHIRRTNVKFLKSARN